MDAKNLPRPGQTLKELEDSKQEIVSAFVSEFVDLLERYDGSLYGSVTRIRMKLGSGRFEDYLELFSTRILKEQQARTAKRRPPEPKPEPTTWEKVRSFFGSGA